MTPERWRQVDELYHAVLELPASDRPALLEQAEPEVRREVESLLAQEGSTLDCPAWEVPAEIKSGTQLGPYKIEVLIGAGGMGQVYRALDSRLGRKVAIKVTAQHFSERLEREARAISALNHPHICTLHDVGPNYLVMEYVEGETLAARIKKGPLPIGEVLCYGSQIASALAEAHSKTITHRDLKPANVMIAKSGVKVLDFGLAKFSEPGGILTQAGAVVGTLAYMAPEQMEGKGTDARTDIYALGLTLYEMATAKRIVQGQPPAMDGLPFQFVHVVERCLAREPEDRWQSASDVKAELDWATKMPLPSAVKPRTRWRYVVTVLGVVVIAAVWSVWQFGQKPVDERDERVTRLQINPPSGGRFAIALNEFIGGMALSPDGRTAAFVATVGEQTGLWVRALDGTSARRLPETDGAGHPFWSPDGKSMAFMANGNVQRVDLAGGAPVTLWAAQGGRGGVWLRDGRMILSDVAGGRLLEAPSPGGTLTPLTELDVANMELAHEYPQSLPGDRLLYLAESSIAGRSGIYAISLAKPLERVRVLSTNVNALYASGYLLWWNGGTLVAQKFDPATFKLGGDPYPLAEGVTQQGPPKMNVAVSANGSLLYDASGPRSQLQWFDPSRRALGPAGDLNVGNFRISPDGRRIATAAGDPAYALWVVDENSTASRMTSDQTRSQGPLWSPDGQTIVLQSRLPEPNLYRMNANGSGDQVRLTQSPNVQFATDWSRDGRSILFYENAPGTQRDLWVLPVTPGGVPDGKPRLYLRTPANESQGRFSLEPNPRWVAYQSDESGRFEVYIRAFPEPGGKFLISRRGGAYPMWGPDGHQLYFESLDNKLMVVSLKFGADWVEASSAPREVFALASARSGLSSPPYDIAPDGKRFLVRVELQSDPGLTLVTNWPALIKKGSAAR